MKRFISIILATTFIISGFAVAAHAQTSPVVLTQTLTVGSTGTEVSALQQFLKDKGFFIYPTITGKFGIITRTATMKFQKSVGILDDGIVGPITRAKIVTTVTPGNPVVSLNNPPVNRYVNVVRDRIAPTVVVTSHSDGDTVSGSVTLTVDAADAKGVVGVQFQIDGVDVGSEDTAAPYSISWDSTSVADDTYALTAIARDAAGNTTTSAEVTLTVTNTPSYSLTVSKPGIGLGVVTSTPTGIDCGATCTTFYDDNTVVTLTASANPGYNFVGWSGGCSGTGACTVTMSEATEVVALFGAGFRTLTVTKPGPGGGVVTSIPEGINCGATCTASIQAYTTVTLIASPAVGGHTFQGWSGACSGIGECTIVMGSPATVNATFNLPTPVY